MGNQGIQRGIDYLVHRKEKVAVSPFRGLEGPMISRSLHLCSQGRQGRNLPEETGNGEDLCQFLGALWGGNGQIGKDCELIGSDGGWAIEVGGGSESGATLMGLSFLLDAPVPWMEELVREGLGYLLRTCCQDGDFRQFSFSGTGREQDLEGRLAFFVLLCQMYRESLLADQAQERQVLDLAQELRKELGALNGNATNYQLGLFLRGISMLGLHEKRQKLVDRLLARQEKDGCWRDEAVGMGPIAVTCAVLDGLAAAQAQPRSCGSKLSFLAREANGRYRAVKDPARGELLEVRMGGDSTVTSRVTVYDGNGHLQESAICGTDRDTVSLWYREWLPGDYEIVVRHWNRPGMGLIGEERHRIRVPLWRRLDTVRVRPCENTGHLFQGHEMTLSPQVTIGVSGNERVSGSASCVLVHGNGEIVWDFGTQGFESEQGGGIMELVFPSASCLFSQAGHYLLKAKAEIDGSTMENSHLIYVGGGYSLEVQNQLIPAELPVGNHVGRVQFSILARGERAFPGVAARIGASAPEEVTVAGDGTAHTITVSGIVDQHGRALERGWLVVGADFGGCRGGKTMNHQGRPGSLTAHGVEHGICHFSYVPGQLNENSVTALSVYGAVEHEGTIQRLDRIGRIELRMSLPQNWK